MRFLKINNFKLLKLSSLNSYMYEVNSIPILSFKEENRLFLDYHDNGNVESAKKIIFHNLKFVINISKKYVGYGLSLSDLIQEGNIGLIKSVKKFNINFKVRLITFAVYWIKAKIYEFILKNWRIVRIVTTASQRKLFFNLRKIKSRYSMLNEEEINNVSNKLSVSKKDVKEMECKMFIKDVNIIYYDDVKDKGNIVCREIWDDNSNFTLNLENLNWNKYIYKKLKLALNFLDNRRKHIIISRWLSKKKLTLSKLSMYYKISIERVRQLEKSALNKLKLIVKNNFL